jgi:hypothetical protein
MSTKEKGDLLEDVITGICSGLGLMDSKVTRNAEIAGRNSRAKRDVDVLIEGRVNAFAVRIAIEAKNYQDRVGVEKVEALHTKLDDIGVDLGVMVSSKGFTQPAKDSAAAMGIQLFEVYDQRLENTTSIGGTSGVLSETEAFRQRLAPFPGCPFGPLPGTDERRSPPAVQLAEGVDAILRHVDAEALRDEHLLP